jgi:hypothetical protein
MLSKMGVYNLVQVMLLYSVVVFPTALQSAKMLFVSILLFFNISFLADGRYPFPKNLFLIAAWYSMIGSLYILWGYFNGGKPLALISVYVAYPLVFSLMAVGWARKEIMFSMPKIMGVACAFVILFMVDNFLYQIRLIPEMILPHPYNIEDYGLRYEAWEFEFSGRQLSSMVFLVPYLFSYNIVSLAFRGGIVKSNALRCISIIAFLISALVGRRALLVSTSISYVILGLLIMLLPQSTRSRVVLEYIKFGISILVVLTVTILTLTAFGLIQPLELIAQFESGFQFDSDKSASTRSLQFEYLFNEWQQSMMFGYGHGTSLANGYLRSTTHPWSYELSYNALLFHVGLVGVIGYSLGFIWMLFKSFKIVRNGGCGVAVIIPVLVGLISMLIANATNPYLEKFDSILYIFLPISAILFIENSERPIGLQRLNPKTQNA